MRTNRIFAIAAAVAALAACTKEQGYNGASFKEGQVVTLNVTADASATKVTSELNGTDVDFKWQADDKILVTVGSKTAEFTLSSGAGDASATFTGTMPAAGSTFDVQYPVTDPTLTAQTYSSSSTEAIPHDKMKFAATGCTTSSPTFTLTPQNAALRLNLWGASQTISKIVVTNTTSSETPKPTYTLTMDSAVTLPTTEASAQAFFIVVPAGDWNFSAQIYDNDDTPAELCTFTPSAAQSFTVNGIVNMPSKEVRKCYPGTDQVGITIGSTVWAPVNCGYSSTYTYGLLYQWGRKYGQAYETGTITPTDMSKADDTESNKDKFGKYNDTDYNWYNDVAMDNTLWNGSSKGTSDPCPTGWRVPTLDELGSLCYTDWDSSSQSGSTNRGSWNSTDKGWDFGDVFLPAAGYRSYYGGDAYDRGDYGYYWSSSVSGDGAWGLVFDDGGAGVDDDHRADGYSVRCVQE